MIKIKETSRDFTEVEQYLMTIAPTIKALKDIEDGTSIKVDGVMIFEDIKESTEEVAEIISIITSDKEVYCGQSTTFKRSMKEIQNIMKDKPFSIIKISGKTNAGRDYINCTLDINSL